MAHKASIALLGCKGMLGKAWAEFLESKSITFTAISHEQHDLRDTFDFNKPKIIINCAAYTDVDAAEEDELVVMAVNGTAVGRLARLCEKQDTKLIHYSSDYVFGADNCKMYQPNDLPLPVNIYGRSKLLGEQLLKQSNCSWLNIRTSWLYASWGNNFVKKILATEKEKDIIEVVNDQFGRPTSCEHLVRTSWRLLGRSGIWHVTDGGDACSWFDFAQAIVPDRCEVKPCKSSDYPSKAMRPKCSALCTKRTEELLGPFPSWRHNLSGVLGRLGEN